VGRTNPTYRDAVRALRERWGDFERALRRRDEPAFERLFEHACEHADAGGYLNHEEPLFPVLVSVDLEQEKRLADLEERLAELEAEDAPDSDAERAASADADGRTVAADGERTGE
jgi:hypothetical protein